MAQELWKQRKIRGGGAAEAGEASLWLCESPEQLVWQKNKNKKQIDWKHFYYLRACKDSKKKRKRNNVRFQNKFRAHSGSRKRSDCQSLKRLNN